MNWPKSPGEDSFSATGYINLVDVIAQYLGLFGGNGLQRDVEFDPPLVLLDLFLDFPVGVQLDGNAFFPNPTPVSATAKKIVWRSQPGESPFVQITLDPSSGYFTVNVLHADLTGGDWLKRRKGGSFGGLNGAFQNETVETNFCLFLDPFYEACVEFLTRYNQRAEGQTGRGSFRLGRDPIAFDEDIALYFPENVKITQRRRGDGFEQKVDASGVFAPLFRGEALKRQIGEDLVTFEAGCFSESVPEDLFVERPAGVFTYRKPRGGEPGVAFFQFNFIRGTFTVRTDFLPEGWLDLPAVQSPANDGRRFLLLPLNIIFEDVGEFGFLALLGRNGTTFQTGATSVVMTPLEEFEGLGEIGE
ncbi:MAG: hypothetical protein M5U26_26250 [Planctomycetota bacterium]|nr:hypothetical protein [Planctomycetota bacterium]